MKYEGYFDTGKKLKDGKVVYSFIPVFLIEFRGVLYYPTDEEQEEVDELMRHLSWKEVNIVSRGKYTKKGKKKSYRKKKKAIHNRDIKLATTRYDLEKVSNFHHPIPKSRGGDRKMELPVYFHRGIHAVFHNLKPDEYIPFIELLIKRMRDNQILSIEEIEWMRLEARRLAQE